MFVPERAVRVLVLAASDADAYLAASALRADARYRDGVTHVSTFALAQAILAAGGADALVVSVDASPAGAAAVTRLRAAAREDLPIVTVGESSERVDGSDDAVTRALVERAPETLARAVEVALRERAAEARVRALARQHEATLQAIPDVIATLDPQGRFVWANRAAEAAFGRSLEDLRARPLSAVAPGWNIDHRDTIVAGTMKSAREEPVIVPVVGRDGKERLYAWTGAPLVDEMGRTQGVIGVGRDVTAEARADERERYLAQARAENARLREMQRERARFFNVLAHEINNPLTVLLLQVDLLKEHAIGNLTSDQDRAVHVLESTLSRLSGLTKDLLDTARIQSGDLTLRPQPIDLRALARDTVEAYAPLAAQASLTVNVVASAPVGVIADPRRIQQVVVNFLTNAIKFTPAGGSITVEVAAVGREARLSVRDTGRGLAPDEMPHLFQPFSQVQQAAAVRGSGLGLFICRGILEAHGGRVTVESAGLGHGSTFTAHISLAAEAPSP